MANYLIKSIFYILITVSVLILLSSFNFVNVSLTVDSNKQLTTIPIVINTWKFTNATKRAWKLLQLKSSSLDAIEKGCSVCEIQQCDNTVGYGGSPDENGETTLDSLIMDGSTMNVGAVADLRNVKNAISVARLVLDRTFHSILVGNQATDFAKNMGFKEESLSTNKSTKMWSDWKQNNCQPNFWTNVTPDPTKTCGPYKPIKLIKDNLKNPNEFNVHNHDTIGMVAIDYKGNIASGTSSNGAKHKIPGRVGDSPIPGSGAYADNDVGGAAATGDGDVMLRFLPSFLAVELMRNGISPKVACETSIKRIKNKFPNFQGAIVALNKFGEHGAACSNFENFVYSIGNLDNDISIVEVACDSSS